MGYFLGIDNGGTKTKAAVYDEAGKEISCVSMATAAITAQPGFVECDMDEMWQRNCDVIRRAVAAAGIGAREIRSVAVCGHGKGLYLLGNDSRPVRNGIISTDSRALRYVEKWDREGISAKVFALTSQSITYCQPVSLLAWLKDHEPGVIEKTKIIFEAKDYIRYKLTGEAATEVTDISGTNLLNLHTKAYDPQILQLLGIEEVAGKLPPIIDSTGIAGHVTREAAEACGLSEGTPVAAGMWDCDACLLSSGIIDDRNISIIAGTWSMNLYLNRHPVVDHSIMMNSIYIDPAYYVIEESSATSASNNEWFLRTFLPEKMKAGAADVYDAVNRWVGEMPAERFSPVFLPYVLGSNVHPDAKGCFVGIDSTHDLKDFSRSVYEGIVFTHKTHVGHLLKDFPGSPGCIRLSGGAARSRPWAQMFSDVLNLPVETVDVHELGTQGCAMAAAVSCGDCGDVREAVQKMCHVAERFEPDAENVAVYEEKYAIYQKTIAALDGIWDDIEAYKNRHGRA